MRDIIKSGLALCLVTVVTSGLLGVAYVQTQQPILANQTATKERAMSAVLPMVIDNNFGDEVIIVETSDKVRVLSYSVGFDGDDKVGYAVSVLSSGYSGNINLLVGIDLEGVVTGVKIVKQTETPGLGANAIKPKFTDQFQNKKDVIDLTKKDNPAENEVVALTSATITSKAVVDAVNSALAFYDLQLKGGN